MAVTKVKQDSHGLFVRAGGYVFRPIRAQSGQNNVVAETKAIVGQEVNARHPSPGVDGFVSVDGVKEIWHSHGCYLNIPDLGNRDTETLWRPHHTVLLKELET